MNSILAKLDRQRAIFRKCGFTDQELAERIPTAEEKARGARQRAKGHDTGIGLPEIVPMLPGDEEHAE